MGQSDVAAQLSFSNNDANDCGKFGRTEAHQDSEDDRTFLPRVDPLERIFDIKNRKERPFVTICGPMVRYSKLPFRALVRDYETDLCYTPMTLAKEFVNSQVARDSEYTTNESDAPVILQFAARTAIDLGNATEIAAPFIDGVDLNCGCPQRWAISEGVGAHLMSRPELVAEMVREAKSRSVKRQNGGPLRVSIKIRVHDDLRRTVDFVRQAEMAGVDWITVHGRTRRQKSIEPVNVDAIALAKSTVSVPVFFNGSIFSLEDAEEMVARTGVDGVMAARGLLANPALFAGYRTTPLSAVARFCRHSFALGSNFFIFHHHMMYMMEQVMSPAERKAFNSLTSFAGVLDFMTAKYGPYWRDADQLL